MDMGRIRERWSGRESNEGKGRKEERWKREGCRGRGWKEMGNGKKK